MVAFCSRPTPAGSKAVGTMTPPSLVRILKTARTVHLNENWGKYKKRLGLQQIDRNCNVFHEHDCTSVCGCIANGMTVSVGPCMRLYLWALYLCLYNWPQQTIRASGRGRRLTVRGVNVRKTREESLEFLERLYMQNILISRSSSRPPKALHLQPDTTVLQEWVKKKK